MRFLISLIFSVLMALCEVAAQGLPADYRRAEMTDTLFKNKIYNSPASFHWIGNTHQFWYLNHTEKGKQFILVNAEKQTREPAFDHQKLAQYLAADSSIDPFNLPFDRISLSENSDILSFSIKGSEYQCDLTVYSCRKIRSKKTKNHHGRYWGAAFDEQSGTPVYSPDSAYIAFIKNSNVYLRRIGAGEEYPLSYDGSPGEFYSTHMQWSPDSKKLMAYKVRPGEKRLIWFIDSAPDDQLQPKLCSREYLKPGDAVAQRKPQIFLIEENTHLPVSDDLFRDQYSLTHIQWRGDSRAITFEFNERGHQRYRVIAVDASTGSARAIIEETSDTFIDYSGKRFRRDVADGKEIIWASERDGWNHLYLYNGVTGKVKNQITKEKWPVRRVVHVDDKKREIIFAAGGLDEGADPYLLQYCRIKFDGSGFKRLTPENADHSAAFSNDFHYFVDQYSRVDLPSTTVLRRASDGKILMELEKADITPLTATGWTMPEVFSAKGRDGKTGIWGVIYRPSHFDESRRYPVIEYIYAGPHGFHTPKSFHPNYRSLHSLAELGFIVVQLDGMGTSGRSKSFHNVCWKNLKDAGFPDRIRWIQAAAEKYPYMDTARVGIFGGSAGGQSSAGALIFHPDFYKAAVSSCGCHDNRMDKIWWNEQWMGYPVGPHYAASSNVVNAHKMEGRLMLILGELDDNVDPSSTMQLVDALVEAGKDFELVVLPGQGHTLGGEYGERKRRDFFVRHLLGVDPPEWSEIYGNSQPDL